MKTRIYYKRLDRGYQYYYVSLQYTKTLSAHTTVLNVNHLIYWFHFNDFKSITN